MNTWHERIQPRSLKIDGDDRNDFQRDKARVMHSAAFRRLQAKTQIMGVGVADFFRTRLTHSLEAAQIATGICSHISIVQPELAKAVKLDEHLIETISLAHDIGHPPFGHGGELALQYMMHEHGGFEGNGQTFRILTRLETYSQNAGMNLSRRSLLGVMKYPNFMSVLTNTICMPQKSERFSQVKAHSWHPPKALYDCDRDIFDWLLAPLSIEDKTTFMTYHQFSSSHSKTLHKSVDSSIMELADDIAYAIHDLEDAVAMNLVSQASFESEITQAVLELDHPWLSHNIVNIQAELFADEPYIRKNAIGALVNVFISEIRLARKHLFTEPLLDFQATLPNAAETALNLFKGYVFRQVIRKPEMQHIEFKGQKIVMALFDVFNNEPTRLLPTNTNIRWQNANTPTEQHRVIADYISGMTDDYASRMYASLFLPKAHNLGDLSY
jgi:dGTPase